MESIAKTTIRQSTKKVRFVLDEVRNNNVNAALAKLRFMNKKAANRIHQTIISAINNMQQVGSDFDADNLFIKDAYVDQGPTMKRFRPAAMGRAVPILKRTSHLTVIVENTSGEPDNLFNVIFPSCSHFNNSALTICTTCL